jgi:ABC-type branched-subunit amino acid transport system substrate-binding protein/cytochrome c553
VAVVTGLVRVAVVQALLWAALALVVLCGASSASALELSEQAQAGKRIFLKGESPSGARITARVGMGGLELSGASVACGNCHGEDGRGRPEGGVAPSNIQWSELTKPYGHDHPQGRRHGAFDEPLLRRAVMDGIDPAGTRLDGAMPRYDMSAKDFSALVAYVKTLELMLDPGLDNDVIRIGTLLPLTGRLASLGESLRTLWTAYFAALNQHGGIHGRRLELVVEPLPADASQARLRARALLSEGGVFAVLAPVSVGIEADMADAATASGMPVIGPLTLFPEDVRASNMHVFHLLPGIAELAQVLVQHAAKELQLAQQPIALWHPDSPVGRASALALEATFKRSGWRAPWSVPFPARAASHEVFAAELKARKIAAVLVLGAGADIAALAASSERTGWTPRLLVPGPLASRDIVDLPAAFRDRVTLAYPTSPGDQRSDALRDFAALSPAGAASRPFQPSQIAAYAAGMLLVEGLKRTGRDLSRRKLIATLESVQGFDTGLMPQLSYNADRRIGAMGGYLVGVDLERKSLRPLGGYVRVQ